MLFAFYITEMPEEMDIVYLICSYIAYNVAYVHD